MEKCEQPLEIGRLTFLTLITPEVHLSEYVTDKNFHKKQIFKVVIGEEFGVWNGFERDLKRRIFLSWN